MKYSSKQLATAFYELLADKPKEHKQIVSRFAAFLQKIGVTKMSNEITRQFEITRLKKENAIKVEIVSAEKNRPIFPTKINGKKTELSWRTDPGLIAGAIIKIGDIRIDNSITRRLSELKKI